MLWPCQCKWLQKYNFTWKFWNSFFESIHWLHILRVEYHDHVTSPNTRGREEPHNVPVLLLQLRGELVQPGLVLHEGKQVADQWPARGRGNGLVILHCLAGDSKGWLGATENLKSILPFTRNKPQLRDSRLKHPVLRSVLFTRSGVWGKDCTECLHIWDVHSNAAPNYNFLTSTHVGSVTY